MQVLLHSFLPSPFSSLFLQGLTQHQGILLSLPGELPGSAGDLWLSVELFNQQGMLLVDEYPSFPSPEPDSSATDSL